MFNAYQFTVDILSLVDSSPRNNVDIAEIIAKYTVGQEIPEQQEARRLISAELIILKNAKEIDYIDSEMSQLSALHSSSFIRHSLNIKSTYERDKKSGNESLITRINELTLEALQRDKDNAELKRQLDETLLKLSEAQHDDIPKAAKHRDDVLLWQIIAGVLATIAFLLKLFGVKGWL